MHFKFLRFQYREFLLAKRVLAAGAGPPVRPAPPADGLGSALFARWESLAALFLRGGRTWQRPFRAEGDLGSVLFAR